MQPPAPLEASATRPLGASSSEASKPSVLQRARSLLGFAPPTLRGLALAGLSGWVFHSYGQGRLDLLLYVVGLLGLALCLLSWLGTALVALQLRRTWPPSAVERLELVTGRSQPTGLHIPAWPRRLLLFEVSSQWLKPGPTRTTLLGPSPRGTWEEATLPTRRCLEESLVRRVVVEDALGLARVHWRVREDRPVRVLPAPPLPDEAAALSSVSGEGVSHPAGRAVGDRVDLRRYVAGDPLRYILWKVFARSRRLVVRCPERALEPRHQTVAYLIAGEGDEGSAALARSVLEEGGLGSDWRFGADGSPAVTSELTEALDTLARSGSIPSAQSGGAGLEAFLDQLAAPFALLLFAPSQDGPWVARALAAAQRCGPGLRVVVGVEGSEGARGSASGGAKVAWEQLLLLPPERPGSGAPGKTLAAQLGERGLDASFVPLQGAAPRASEEPA